MLKGKRIVDLSHDIWPGKEEYGLELESRFVDEVYPNYRRRPDVWYILQTLNMSTHVGTHIDSLGHFSCNGVCFGGKAVAQSYETGMTELSVDRIEPISRRGVLLDVAGTEGFQELPEDFEITPEHVWLSEAGRKKALQLFEQRLEESHQHPHTGQSMTYARLVELEVRLLEKEWTGCPGLFARMRLRMAPMPSAISAGVFWRAFAVSLVLFVPM